MKHGCLRMAQKTLALTLAVAMMLPSLTWALALEGTGGEPIPPVIEQMNPEISPSPAPAAPDAEEPETEARTEGDNEEEKTSPLLEEEVDLFAAHEIDTVTQGDWIGKYGADGYYFFGYNSDRTDLNKLPAYVTEFTVTPTGRNGRWSFGKGSSGLPLTSDTDAERVNAALYADEDITISFDIPAGTTRQIAIYQAGDGTGRINGIKCVSKAEGNAVLLEMVSVGAFAAGKYVVFEINQPCTITISSENDNFDVNSVNLNNALVNAVFFDTTDENAPVESISIYPEDGETTRFGMEPIQMKAAILPAAVAGKTVEWSITGDGASISNAGLVTVTKPGAFTVSAKAGDKTATSTMLVLNDGAAPESTTLTEIGRDFIVLENAQVSFLFNLKDGTYSVYRQADNRPYVLNAHTQVNDARSDDGYTFTCAEVVDFEEENTSYEQPKTDLDGKAIRLTGSKTDNVGIVLEVTIDSGKGSLVLANGIVNNTGAQLKLMKMYPLVAQSGTGGGIFAGPNPAENHDVMTGGGDWQTPQIHTGVNATTKNVATISYRDSEAGGLETFLLGGLTTYEFQNEVKVSNPAGNAIENNGRKSIDACIRVFDFTGKLVDAGQTYMADKTFLNFNEPNPYYALEDYGREYADAMNVDLVCYNEYVSSCLWYVDWFNPGANNADYGVDQARKMAETGMAKYAPPLIRLVPDTYSSPNEQLWWDDAHWKSFGHLTDNYPTLKAYGDGVRAQGGVPGMYMQPTYPNKDYNAEHTDHMIGNTYLSGPDYTDPGFIAHMRGVYENMKEAGVVSNFYDYSYMFMKQDDALQKPVKETNILELTSGFEDEYATAVSAYRNIYKIAKDVYPEMALTENPWYSVGQSVAIGVIDSQRAVGDANGFDQRIARTGITQWFRNEVTKLVDPDVKVFNMENEDLRRAEVTGTGLFFGKTMFGRPVEDYNDQCIKDIGRIYPMPIDGVTARPVGLFEAGSQNPNLYDYVFNGDRDDHVLLMWNYDSAESETITADLGLDTAYGGIGLDAAKEYDVWDFWDWRYIGRFQGDDTLALNVRPDEMKTLAVREVDDVRILSTNRHVLQGEVDTANVALNGSTLTGTLKAVGEDTYKAIVMLPEQTDKIKAFTTDLTEGTAAAEKNPFGYVEITIDVAVNTEVAFTLELEPGEAGEDTQAPSVPWEFRATDVGGKTQLDWEASTDDSGFVQYRVYRSASMDTPLAEEDLIAVTNDLRCRDTMSIVPNVLYIYRVVAVDAAGNVSAPAAVKLVSPVEEIMNDGTTGGAGWEANYGKEGQVFYNKLHDEVDAKVLPSYIQDVTATASGKWKYTPGNSAAFTFGGTQYLGCLYDPKKITVVITAKDNLPHSIALYSADADKSLRTHVVTAYSLATGEQIAEKTVDRYEMGIYTVFNFSGSIRVELTRTKGVNIVLNAIFFDEARDTEPLEVPNSAPYALRLSADRVSSNAPVGTLVGNLAAMDADQGDTVTYRAKGENAFFAVEENRLVTKNSLSGAAQTERVTVEAVDSQGGIYEETLAIQVEAGVVPPPSATGETSKKPIVTVSSEAGGKVEAKRDGSVAITANEGWKIKDVLVNGVSKGAVATLTGLTAKDRVEVIFERTDPASGRFADVPAGVWYGEAVQYVVDEGLFQGTAAGTFAPADKMTRAMLWTVLARLDGQELAEGGIWYAGAMDWARKQGLSDGNSPESNISREQLLTMLWRYSGSPEAEGELSGYSDAEQVSPWARQAFAWAAQTGIVQGTTDKKLAPKSDAARAQVAVMLMRFCQSVQGQ